jgi:hypothetical protein
MATKSMIVRFLRSHVESIDGRTPVTSWCSNCSGRNQDVQPSKSSKKMFQVPPQPEVGQKQFHSPNLCACAPKAGEADFESPNTGAGKLMVNRSK